MLIMDKYLLEMRNIKKVFPGVVALNDVNLTVKPGEVHVLLGENGAGKSTLIKILSGAYSKTEGEIFIDGQAVEINKPMDAFKYGISVIYQEFNLNPFMAIYENILLGKEYTGTLGLIDRSRAIAETSKACASVGLTAHPKTLVKDLSVAQKQLVEIAKAIISDVRILVLDEPTATLTDNEIERLFEIIEELKHKGVGIIYISHRMKELKRIGDRCTILRDGTYVGTVNLSETSDEELIHMMVGRKVDFSQKKACYAKAEEILCVRGLNYQNLLKNVSFTLRKGEILGVAGLVGSGRTEMAKCLVGAYKKTTGDVALNGNQIKIRGPAEAIKEGIVYLSEDRKGEGLVLKHDVQENICISSLGKMLKGGFLNKTLEKSCAEEISHKLAIKTPGLHTLVQDLSGGNQQKVVIGKWLLAEAQVYIFDEPTRGIDVGARQEIYSIMEGLVQKGASVIMISSDLVEILRLSDRIMIMCNGEVANITDNYEGLRQEDILAYALGGVG